MLGRSMIEWAAKENLDVSLLKVNDRPMTDEEIFAMFPVPPPYSMWGSPAGHLKLYTTFGGKLSPVRGDRARCDIT